MVQFGQVRCRCLLLSALLRVVSPRPVSQPTKNLQQQNMQRFLDESGLPAETMDEHNRNIFSAAEALEQRLLQDGVTPIKRINIELVADAAVRRKQAAEIFESLKWNIPVVISNAEPWPAESKARNYAQHVRIVNETLTTWLESERDRFDGYWIGGGAGRHAPIMPDVTDWSWPLAEHIRWMWEEKTYGSFGTPDAVERFLQSEHPYMYPPWFHIDNTCQFAFALQMSGAKLYWTQGPDIGSKNESEFRESVNYFYQKHKLLQFPARDKFVSRFAVLRPGEMILYMYWMPHTAMPVAGHAFSYNGDFDVVWDEDHVQENACPGYLKQLCDLSNTAGYPRGPAPVQPWDEEWAPLAQELLEVHVGGFPDIAARVNSAKEKWQGVWRKRICSQPGGQPQDDKNAGRDADCEGFREEL